MATMTAHLSPHARREGRAVNAVLLVDVVDLALDVWDIFSGRSNFSIPCD